MAQPKDKMPEIDEHIYKKFDIKKRLGKGAYGIVWKAIDRKSKDVVAVKKIFDAFRNQTDAQRTFREIMFLRSFKDHTNIIKLRSIHRAANNKDIYLGFEYMETDLHNVIKRGNVLKDVHKRFVMYQLLKAIKYIHSGDVIHRDLKPSNVLLDGMCRCKIADFGLARSLTHFSDQSPSVTDPTLTDYVATRWYRAPEILIANRNYTKGIDMWSIGCILAEMLYGKPIFPGSSTVNQIELIMSSIDPPTSDDIKKICVSGVSTSMIRNTLTAKRVPIKNMLGFQVPKDGLDLVGKLLLFNPYKRLNAEQALKHDYVERFHSPSEEIVVEKRVTPPFNDDIRLSVDDYRNKLYEIMSTPTTNVKARTITKTTISKPKPTVKSTSSSIVSNKIESKIKIYKDPHQPSSKSRLTYTKTPYTSQSEPKIRSVITKTTNIKSDSKIPVRMVTAKPIGREKVSIMSHGDSIKTRNNVVNGKTNNTSFSKTNTTSYSKTKTINGKTSISNNKTIVNENNKTMVNVGTATTGNKEKTIRRRVISKNDSSTGITDVEPGVITESALFELRAARMR